VFILSFRAVLLSCRHARTVYSLDQTGFKVLSSPKVPPKSYYVWRYKGTDELLFRKYQAAKQSLKQQRSGRVLILMMRVKRGKASRQTAKFLATNQKQISC